MSHSLGMTTTAEGVESLDQLDQLNIAGCDQAQGFLLGKPMDLQSTLMLLKNSEAS